MPDSTALPPSPGMDPEQVANLLGVAPDTLAKWRVFGKGPAFRKIGRRVVYPVAEVVAFVEAQPLRRSTSDAGTPAAPDAPSMDSAPRAAAATRRRAA